MRDVTRTRLHTDTLCAENSRTIRTNKHNNTTRSSSSGDLEVGDVGGEPTSTPALQQLLLYSRRLDCRTAHHSHSGSSTRFVIHRSLLLRHAFAAVHIGMMIAAPRAEQKAEHKHDKHARSNLRYLMFCAE